MRFDQCTKFQFYQKFCVRIGVLTYNMSLLIHEYIRYFTQPDPINQIRFKKKIHDSFYKVMLYHSLKNANTSF